MSKNRGSLKKRYQAIAAYHVRVARAWQRKAQIEANQNTETRLAFSDFAEEANRIMEESAQEQYDAGYEAGYEDGYRAGIAADLAFEILVNDAP